MKVRVLGCSGGVSEGHDSTCLLLGDDVLVDAGTGARRLSAKHALQIKDIVISHSHLDHVTSICFIADQDIVHRKESTRIHSLPETAASLRRYIVNEIIWPEIEKVVINGVQMVEFHSLRAFETVEIGGNRITPLPVSHAVPTVGFCFHGDEHEMVFISDMINASDETWEWIKARKKLKYFVSEAAFPNQLEEIARISKHMTPKMLEGVCGHLPAGVEIYATHLKPLYHDEIVKEIGELDPKLGVKILEADMEFDL